MTDIPEHLTDALSAASGSAIQDEVAAVLAALRPEDVPAWAEDEMRILALSQRVSDLLVERDEARAEVERLQAENADLRRSLNETAVAYLQETGEYD